MSEVPTGHQSFGVTAYRWLIAIGIGLLTLMAQRTLAGIDETSRSVQDLRTELRSIQASVESRINAHALRLDGIERRNDRQDVDLDELKRRVYPLTRGTP